MSRVALPSGTPGELVEAPSGSPRRGVVVAPDIMGLRPLFDDLCARLAAEHDWTVCAVEPFPGREDLPVEVRLQTPLDPERVLADLVAAADETRAERVAVLGFCRGGMHAFQAAGTGRFDRAVAFYGMIRVPEEWRPGRREPLEELARPEACPTLAVLGGRDSYTPADDIEALRTLANVEIAFYPEADHGFVHDPARPTHRADDAADAWRRVAHFLA
ncbi:MAG TPA: dienelactone hydrolase family protein [Acidimicrobiales bacterium]|nr:dienelactone hydrolase family protein [Acidimicrobiales bacterium]